MKSLTQNTDLALAFGVVGILVVMMVPMPSVLLDMLLSLNITLGLVILLVAMYAGKPLDFSVFPSILLVSTLFRLSLNIASTRLILLNGHEGTSAAGQVIRSFGSFVVGGNYVVGLIVFMILVLINFIVITKGATRVAEVAARFTLDAMPGKQMAIDADLNAGLIDESEARKRRVNIAREADFYGSMDGASKFVRGDAIAGIIITLINIFGGLIIGVVQRGLPVVTAAENYTLLTVGDGLVSQIPALIISTAAGLIVTRAGSETNLSADIMGQLFFNPRAVGVAALIVFCFGLIPGLPKMPFFLLALIAGGVAYLGFKGKKQRAEAEKVIEEEKAAVPPAPEQVEALLPLDVLELEVGYGIIPLVDSSQDGVLLEKIKSIRRQFALEMGFIVPAIHIRDNLQLGANEYALLIKGIQVAKGEILPDHYLAMHVGETDIPIEGIDTKEPAFGLPAKWIHSSDKDRAQAAGYTVVDSSTVVATHLTELVRTHAAELVGRQEVQGLLDKLAETHPKAVEELVPGLLSLGGVQKVLQNLLKEGVSVRDLLTVVETLADYAPGTRNQDLLTEYVRQRLARTITRKYQLDDGSIPLMTVDRQVEDVISSSLREMDHEQYLAIEPGMAQRIITQISRAMEVFGKMNFQPVFLCSPAIRSHLKRLTERFFPQLAIISHNEITPEARIHSLGVLNI